MQPIKSIAGHVKLPGSKSLSNRILLLAALAKGTTTVLNLLVSFLDLPSYDVAGKARLQSLFVSGLIRLLC